MNQVQISSIVLHCLLVPSSFLVFLVESLLQLS